MDARCRLSAVRKGRSAGVAFLSFPNSVRECTPRNSCFASGPRRKRETGVSRTAFPNRSSGTRGTLPLLREERTSDKRSHLRVAVGRAGLSREWRPSPLGRRTTPGIAWSHRTWRPRRRHPPASRATGRPRRSHRDLDRRLPGWRRPIRLPADLLPVNSAPGHVRRRHVRFAESTTPGMVAPSRFAASQYCAAPMFQPAPNVLDSQDRQLIDQRAPPI